MPDLDLLLKRRLVVARFGEMDNARWWNTNNQLGRLGSAALRRGFPRTHYFAQARSVFAVAAHRCAEVFDPPNAATLWKLHEDIEEEFDERWEYWLENGQEWQAFFEALQAVDGVDLIATMKDLDLIGESATKELAQLRRSAESRAVRLPGEFSGEDGEIALLALAFAIGETGALSVPYKELGS